MANQPSPADRYYSSFAHLYDWTVKLLPVWRRWIGRVLPHVRGPRVLEVSFGTGMLLDAYGPQVQVYGLDYNREMIGIARRNSGAHGRRVPLLQGDVYDLPFAGGAFDTVVNTMAFSGYLDGGAALGEMSRVLRPGGRLVMVDVNYPQGGSWLGLQMARAWKALGDILWEMEPLFREAGLDCRDQQEIGGWGSVHLYVATKPGPEPALTTRE